MLRLAGVTVMEVSVGVATVIGVVPATAPEVAVMVVVPGATAVAMPLLEIVAIEEADELQVTDVVRFLVELSEYVPVAMYC
jgi:hypothetical protein